MGRSKAAIPAMRPPETGVTSPKSRGLPGSRAPSPGISASGKITKADGLAVAAYESIQKSPQGPLALSISARTCAVFPPIARGFRPIQGTLRIRIRQEADNRDQPTSRQRLQISRPNLDLENGLAEQQGGDREIPTLMRTRFGHSFGDGAPESRDQ